MKREMGEKEKKWEIERKNEKMEKKFEVLELGKGDGKGLILGKGGKSGGMGDKEIKELMEKLSNLEWKLEKREREERRRNVVIKVVKEEK